VNKNIIRIVIERERGGKYEGNQQGKCYKIAFEIPFVSPTSL
jgi:hypothetical protein